MFARLVGANSTTKHTEKGGAPTGTKALGVKLLRKKPQPKQDTTKQTEDKRQAETPVRNGRQNQRTVKQSSVDRSRRNQKPRDKEDVLLDLVSKQ